MRFCTRVRTAQGEQTEYYLNNLNKGTTGVRILLTNDDGIFAPGLQTFYKYLKRLGQVEVAAPAVNQSGVSHSITYLTPLIVEEIFQEERHFGWQIFGSPADCVKLAMLELLSPPPEVVVSGINGGSNLGINVLYSGTVAAAIEGAFFGVPSFAVSLAMDHSPNYDRAAQIAVALIEQILSGRPGPGTLWNMNIPALRPGLPVGVKVLPMGIKRYREKVERRLDPRGRSYYWCGADTSGEHPLEPDTDVEAAAEGFVSLTPLHFDLTKKTELDRMSKIPWVLPQT